MPAAVDVGLRKGGNVFKSSCEGSVISLVLHVVDEALLSKAVHHPGEVVTFETSPTGVVQLELVCSEGTILNTTTTKAASEVEGVFGWVTDLDPRTIATKAGVGIEDLGLEDGSGRQVSRSILRPVPVSGKGLYG